MKIDEYSLESIIESGLTGNIATDPSVEIPAEDCTEGDVNDAVLESQDTIISTESFITWANMVDQHIGVLRSISSESYARATEADTGNKVAEGFKKVILHVWNSFKNFIMKIVNFFRTIGMEKKCKKITELAGKVKVSELDTDNAHKYGDASLLLGVENLFNTTFIHNVKTTISYHGVQTNKTVAIQAGAADDAVRSWVKDNEENLAKRELSASQAFTKYIHSKGQDQFKFFTKDFESALGTFNQFFAPLTTTASTPAQKNTFAEVRAMYSLCLKAYSQWIHVTKMVYSACKKANGEAGSLAGSDEKAA